MQQTSTHLRYFRIEIFQSEEIQLFSGGSFPIVIIPNAVLQIDRVRIAVYLMSRFIVEYD